MRTSQDVTATGQARPGETCAQVCQWAVGYALDTPSPQELGEGPTYSLREILGVPCIAEVLHLQGHYFASLHETHLMKEQLFNASPSSVSDHLPLCITCRKQSKTPHHGKGKDSRV